MRAGARPPYAGTTAGWRSWGSAAGASRPGAGALPNGRLVAVSLHPQAFVDDCRRAAILVTALPMPPGCDGPMLVVDRKRLARYGAHGLRWPAAEAAPRLETARSGLRPWAPVSSDFEE